MNDVLTAVVEAAEGVVVAAAGCGKTYLVAEAVSTINSGRPQLVLTHTHAGVSAIRKQLKKFGARSCQARVETISGWALRYASSYPTLSGYGDIPHKPEEISDWEAVYVAAATLVRMSPVVRDVIRRSYAGVFVDEYQDCTTAQHDLVVTLRGIMPCRILGDPLQGIFAFAGSIDWQRDVVPAFTPLPSLCMPRRWEQPKANGRLGKWLSTVRQQLESGQEVSLVGAPVTWKRLVPEEEGGVAVHIQVGECLRFLQASNETVVAIHNIENISRNLASRLKGHFSCVEAIECKDLFRFAHQIGESSGPQRAAAVLSFAEKCMTQVSSALRGASDAYGQGRHYRPKTPSAQTNALREVALSEDVTAVLSSLSAFQALPNCVVYREELLSEMRRALRECAAGNHSSLAEAAWHVRNRTRQMGRKQKLRIVGSTLLVKGMEFDHAIVLDADALDSKNLYVAMTRGTRSLTILSASRTLNPHSG